MNIVNILALTLFIVGIILLLDRKSINNDNIIVNIKKQGKSLEGLSNEDRLEQQIKLLDNQKSYYNNRRIPRMVAQEHKITNTLRVVDTKKKNIFRPQQNIDGVAGSKSQVAKEVEKCRTIDQVGDCSLIAGTKCGYCLSSNKILYGDANGPLVDTCEKNSPGKYDKWSPPGVAAPAICTKLKERAICARVKDCGDVGGFKQICSWCPIKGKGMVFKYNNEGGKEPKYPEDDKCEWPYKGAPGVQKTQKWHGWEGKMKDTRTYSTVYVPAQLIHRPNETTGSYINSSTNLNGGFSQFKSAGARYARWDATKGMWNFHRAGSSDNSPNYKIYRVDNWTSQQVQTGGSVSLDRAGMEAGGDCDADSDCPTGWKCGDRGSGKIDGISGLYNKKHNKDYCYDPNVKSMHGPLVPLESCSTFAQNFPCMTPNLLTGPHTVACYQDLWAKSGCNGDVMARTTANATGRAAKNVWDKSAYTVVGDNMKSFATVAASKDYEKANTANMMCYGEEVDPCASRFVDAYNKISRPRKCIDKMYQQSGCTKDGKLHPDNLKNWKNKKGGGIPANWEENQNYGWSAYGYRGKLRDIRRKARDNKALMGSGEDIQKMHTYADKAIYYNELCYGKTPEVPSIESGIKPCWKDFVELVMKSHDNVGRPDSVTLVFKLNDMEIGNNYMKDDNIFRRTLGALGLIGQDWGSQKKITKDMYEKKHFPYWKFYHKSRKIYDRRAIWEKFKTRVKVFPGVKVTTDSVQFEESNMMALVFKQYKLVPREEDKQPHNGKCPSCDLVPCGQCQAGCPGSTCPGGTRNMCANNNRNKTPTVCDLPPKYTITRKLWLDEKFPYWAFMRTLKRMESHKY